MKCPECNTSNSDKRRFCAECGAKLSIACPNCKFENLPSDKFCGDCGNNLKSQNGDSEEVSFREKLERIQKYLPQGITEKILSQKDKIEGERKQVTVMFCDIVGFTEMVESLGTEEAYSMMDNIYEILIHKVHFYGGTVNEMTGDGVLALFGAPIALENAPQRAIRSGISIHRELIKYSDRKKNNGIPNIKMRIGIHTGPVIVGTLGNDLRVEFKAVGDTVNLASRVEEMAEPGSSYVTEVTFKLTEGLFRFEALGRKNIKGKKDSIYIYRVIAKSSRRTRFDVSAEKGLTPLVGRDREIEYLFDGFNKVKNGQGQAYSIVAEAGAGKSRVLYEFRKRIANENVSFLEGKCLSYSKNMAFYPIIDILKASFNIENEDNDNEIANKVSIGIKLLNIEDNKTLPYILELLGITESGVNTNLTSVEEKKARIFDALKLITIKGSEYRPLIIIFEDLHWIENSSEEFLIDILNAISGYKMLLILSYRHEYRPRWGSRSNHYQINLSRLTTNEINLMAANLLETKNIDKELLQLIQNKSEGNPLYLEEFVKSLRDLKLIDKEDKYFIKDSRGRISIPSTIQEVFMVRIDSLPKKAKELLQSASVLEREFSYKAIKLITDLSDKILYSLLSVLKDSEIIFERGIFPQSSYIFKHSLARDVIYSTILRKKKTVLHRKAAETIEYLFKDKLNEHYGMLSEHFLKSKNYNKCNYYASLAAKKALKTASFTQAIEYTENCIMCLESLPQTNQILEQIIDARTKQGLYYIQLNLHNDAKKSIDPIIKQAETNNYWNRLSQIYTILGAYNLYIKEDLISSTKYFKKAIKISTDIQDIVSLVIAHFGLGHAMAYDCEFVKASSYFNEALKINKSVSNLWGIAACAAALSFFVVNQKGNISKGCEISSKAFRIADKSGDIFSKTFAVAGHAYSCYLIGKHESSINHFKKAIELSEKSNLVMQNVISHINLAEVYYDNRDYQLSKKCYRKALYVLDTNSLQPSMINLCRICLAKIKAKENKNEVEIEPIVKFIGENRIKQFDGWLKRSLAELLLELDGDHITESKEWINKAIKEDTKNGMEWQLARDYEISAQIYKAEGNPNKFKEHIDMAIIAYRRCDAEFWVERLKRHM